MSMKRQGGPGRTDEHKLCTDSDFVLLSEHDVIRGEVSMDNPLLFVQISQC